VEEKMNVDKSTVRLLGVAFLIQAVASLIASLILLEPLIESGSIIDTMTNVSNNVLRMRASIVFHMITAMGVVMLGALLFLTLKEQNRKIAQIALGLYIIEAAILAASRIPAFSLMRVSQESVMAGHPDYLQSLGNLFLESAEFGDWLHMLAFALGATFFYYLFLKSRYIPRFLPIWGLVAAPLALIGTLVVLFGYDVPIFVFIPNLPFELTMGVWMIVWGIKDRS
jgi:hypothetical protein